MVSGINSYGMSGSNWFSYSAMNDMKLMQALSARGKSVDRISSIQKPGSALNSDAADFLKSYQSSLTDLEKAAKELMDTNANGVLNAKSVVSSDKSVLEASARYALSTPESYTVDVKQLATSQINISGAVRGEDVPTQGGSMTLDTQEGTFQLDIDPVQAQSNEELYSAIAKEINGLKTGVTAQVARSNGEISLVLSGNETGKGATFSVTGDFAEKSGLATVSQKAQDAVYTVDKASDSLGPMEFTSSENKVTIGGYKIEANLRKEGTAEIHVGTDSGAVADKMEALVNAYNKTYNLLDANSDRGIGVLKQMRRMVQPPTGQNSMKLAGVTIKADGTYNFDRTTFLNAMDKNPSLIRDVVGGSHGMAQGILQDVRAGQQASSASLVGTQAGALKNGESQLFQQQSTLNFMSSYNKSGVYNMMNFYAVGALMNMNV